MLKLLLIDMGAAWGGQEIYSRSLGTHLERREWMVTNLSPHSCHTLHEGRYHQISIDYKDFKKTARAVSDLQDQHDLVHFNGIRAIYLSNFCRKSKPFIGTKHLPYAMGGEKKLKDRVAAASSLLVFRKLDWLIAISNKTIEELPAWVRSRAGLILNGVEDVGRQKTDLPLSPLRLCYVGRLVEHKGIMRLLQAAHMLKGTGTSFRLLVAGNGPLEAQAKAYVESHNLKAEVQFLGFVDQPGDVYRQCHVCVLPSLHEGLPLSLLEALSAGCALVGHDIPGVADVIEDDHNGLIAPISAEGLAVALRRFATDRVFLERVRQAARGDYEKKWRVERMVEETEAIYQMAMASFEIGRHT